MSEAEVNALKDQGNAHLQAGRVQEAVQAYSQAIDLDPKNHILFSNRSAARLKLGDAAGALSDAEAAIGVNPTWSKGYQRKGSALQALQKYNEAVKAFDEALKLEPGNAIAMQGRSDSYREMRIKEAEETQQVLRDLFTGDVLMKARLYPEIRPLCDDPDFVDKILSVKKHPETLQQALMDERIQRFAAVAVQYNKLEKMSPEERDAHFRKEAERMEAEAKREAEAEERIRQREKAEKAERERKRKEEEEASLTEVQRKARDLKTDGHAAYKAKKFEEALRLYEEASKVDEKDMTHRNNMAAALLELGRVDEALQVAQDAVEQARANRAPFAVVGRALQRMGSAYMRKNMFAEAIEAYKKSLMEDRTKETLNLLKKAEKAHEEEEKKKLIDPEKALACKEEGNVFFKSQKFPEAVERYSQAIKHSPDDATLYSNRATAYMKLMAYPEALRDLERAIDLKPDFIKAYLKKGHVHQVLKEYQKCLQTYEQALQHAPDDAEVVAAVQQTVALINQQGAPDKETVARNVSKDPELQRILRDPKMQQVLQDLQTDPTALDRHMSDPIVAQNINALIAAGVLRQG